MEKNLAYYMSLNYPIQLQKMSDDLGGGYMATISQFGKAIIGDGKTEEEAIKDMEIAKEMAFEFFLEKGFPISEPESILASEAAPSGKFVTRIPPELHARMNKMAHNRGISRNAYVEESIQEKVEMDEFGSCQQKDKHFQTKWERLIFESAPEQGEFALAG